MNYPKDLVELISKKAFSYDKYKQLLADEDGHKFINDVPSFLKDADFVRQRKNNATEPIPDSKLNEANQCIQPVFKFQGEQNRSLKILDGDCSNGVHLLELEKNDFVNQHNSAAEERVLFAFPDPNNQYEEIATSDWSKFEEMFAGYKKLLLSDLKWHLLKPKKV